MEYLDRRQCRLTREQRRCSRPIDAFASKSSACWAFSVWPCVCLSNFEEAERAWQVGRMMYAFRYMLVIAVATGIVTSGRKCMEIRRILWRGVKKDEEKRDRAHASIEALSAVERSQSDSYRSRHWNAHVSQTGFESVRVPSVRGSA